MLASSENIFGAVIADIPTESFRMALAVVIIAPIIVSYPFFRKYLVKGLTAGAGKQAALKIAFYANKDYN